MSDPTPPAPTPDSRREFLKKALRTAGYVPPAIIAMGMGNLAAAQATPPVMGMMGMMGMMSDRDSKTAVVPVDGREILDRLAAVPVGRWSYKADAGKTPHIGPMAQDFKKAFDVGSDERVIPMIDASGVALASIQGLYQIVRDQRDRIAELEARLAKMERRAD
jgi:hypothetical protein